MAKPELDRIGSVKSIINKIKENHPLTPGWMGACLLLASVSFLIYIVQGYYLLGTHGFGDFLTGALIFLLGIFLATGVIAGVLHIAKKMPTRYIWVTLTSVCLLIISFIGPLSLTAIVVVSIIIAVSVLGALLYRFFVGKYQKVKLFSKVIAILLAMIVLIFIGTGMYWLLDEGHADPMKPYWLKMMKAADRYQTNLENPTVQGSYPVHTLSYGSTNSYRKEFNQRGSLLTKPVNGSAFIENWSSIRTDTFGFGPDKMPLNGLVWYPEGKGPFPLIVAVHGNHIATDYSDPGYEYLGKLLASRGYIFVSIDQNFLNTSPYDDLFMFRVLEQENLARGWLILEHLKTWEKWNKIKSTPFFEKVDMSRIALIGHSRGGEAVTVATAFNQLDANPENGNIKFNYHFGIRSVISIAGTDQQYKPTGKPIFLKDLNYLAIQGSHDMDVSSFDSASQYSRINFSGGSDYFKSSVYIYRANHGQFNSKWGKIDGVGLGNKLYNIGQLMSQEEQQQAAKVLISSFLDATIKGKNEYKQIFQDIGYAQRWLPDTMYISNYWDSHTELISSFDEDINLESTTLTGGRLIGENLKAWKEEKVEMKFTSELYSAVRLEWNHEKTSNVPSYTADLTNSQLDVRNNSSVVFSMANADDEKSSEENDSLIDLTIKVVDKNGDQATLPLSSVTHLLPMLEGKIIKWPFTSFSPTKEPVFQNFSFRLADFQKVNPNFDPDQLSNISFVFDRSKKGTVLINDIGIRNKDVARRENILEKE
ncbi:alpha/beta hydrolase [Risungbinella massiliensis]|uniref:poly(ethylene terephthalate) hydrolase family protein n=1 Tax=Risungbinella massiliensis TaxID=1329796 RepID=UPI0005CBADFC|nr:hypothetical protein [Risungbinella massiliensis]